MDRSSWLKALIIITATLCVLDAVTTEIQGAFDAVYTYYEERSRAAAARSSDRPVAAPKLKSEIGARRMAGSRPEP